LGRVIKIDTSVNIDDLNRLIESSVGAWRIKRIQVVRAFLSGVKDTKQIALVIGYSVENVRKILAAFKKDGLDSFNLKGRSQRQNAYLSFAEEEEFLKKFYEEALTGKMTTVSEIKSEFESLVGKKVNLSTIYRLLKRHKWRKIEPRPCHINSDKDRQNEFKKNLRTSKDSCL